MDEATGDTRDEESVRDLELEGVVDLLALVREHGVELLGLDDRAGEAVEDEAGGGADERRHIRGRARGREEAERQYDHVGREHTSRRRPGEGEGRRNEGEGNGGGDEEDERERDEP